MTRKRYNGVTSKGESLPIIHTYGDMIHIKDNEYDCTFEYGEWN